MRTVPEQIPLRELLKDPLYRKWLAKIPHEMDAQTDQHKKPWRVWVQRERDGRWAFKDFTKYSEAYKFVAQNVKGFWDMALHCKAHLYRHPRIKQGLKRVPWTLPEGHDWCGLCRRPTIFRSFKHHHAFGRNRDGSRWQLSNWRRCSICGIRLEGLLKR